MCYFGRSQCPALSVIKSAFTQGAVKKLAFCCGSQYHSLCCCCCCYKEISICMFLLLFFLGVGVEDPGVPGLPQPNTEPHHRIRPAGWLPALCLLCDWRKISGTGHLRNSFHIVANRNCLEISLKPAGTFYIGFCNKRRWYYVENSSLQLHQPNAVQSVWCVSVIRM